MAYRIEEGEGLPAEIRRIAREEIDAALESLGAPAAKRADGVHDARKSFKKLRALLALVESEMGRARARAESQVIRNAGRALASARDAEVMVGALDSLKRRFGEELDATAFAEIRRRLMRERLQARKRLASDDDVVRRVDSDLAQLRARVDAWPLERDSFGAVAKGLRRAYGCGRRMRSSLPKGPTTEEFHDWRKCVKSLWYHVRLLERCWAPMLKCHASALDSLAESLGEDHDLGVLRELVHERGFDGTGALVALLDQRRAELQVEALHAGRLLYAERTGEFVKRMRRYWKASRTRLSCVDKDVSDWRARATAADVARQ
jgi:CHAD domain-containing protein